MLAPLGFVLALSFGIQRMSAGTAMLLFWLYAAVMGLSLGGIFLVYTGTSIARVFFITAATYGAISLYGYTTKTDLSGFGSFLERSEPDQMSDARFSSKRMNGVA